MDENNIQDDIYTPPELIWIDCNVNNSENEEYKNQLKEILRYKTYESIEPALDEIKRIKFERVTILLSRNIFKDFIPLFEREKNNICCSLNILVFTYNKKFVKEICKNNKNISLGYLFKETNIFGEIEEVISSIRRNTVPDNFEEINEINRNYYNNDEKIGNFEKIENYEELILPIYFRKIIEPITYEEIDNFNYYLTNFGGEIRRKIKQLENMAKMPNEIISKYWAYIYSLENNNNNFYLTLNLGLKNKKYKLFLPFIKMMYEASIKKYFPYVQNEKLYSGGLISKKELEKLRNNLNDNNNNEIPKVIYYLKSFKSFSKSRTEAEKFIQPSTKKSTGLLFILEKCEDKIEEEYISNAYINAYSKYNYEDEVLFFPFSSFEVKSIEDKENYVIINLKYLGKYRPYIEEKKSLKNIFKDIPISQFGRDITESGIIKYKFYRFWEIKKEINISTLDIINATSILYLGNNKILFSVGNCLKLYDFQNDKYCYNIFVHKLKINDLLKINEKTFISSSDDKTIKIIEFKNNFSDYLLKQSIEFHLKEVNQTIKLKQNNFFASCSNDKTIIIWKYDFNNNSTRYKMINDNSEILSILELPNSNLVSISKDGDLNFWNDNSVKIKTLKGFINSLHNSIFLFNEEIIIIGTIKKIFLIDIIQKEIIKIFNLYYDACSICHFNGNIFLGLNHNKCLLYECQIKEKSRQMYFEYVGKGMDNCLEISFISCIDEKTIITSNKNNYIKIWEETKKKPDILKKNYIPDNIEEEYIQMDNNSYYNNQIISKEMKELNNIINDLKEKLNNEKNNIQSNKYIQLLKEELYKEKKEKDYLTNRKNELEKLIYYKDIQLKDLEKKNIEPNENILTINFVSARHDIDYCITCKKTDSFNKVVAKLFDKYPKYKDLTVYFMHNALKIMEYKTIE